jgi:hypothetical protein
MYTGLLHLHSFFRYIALFLLVFTTIKFLNGFLSKKQYAPLDNKLSLFTFISMHLQLTIGLILYFISPIVHAGLADMGAAMKEPALRFWTVEHIAMMLLAIILISVGRISAKKAQDDHTKFKKQAIFFLIGLIIILVSIPWPFSKVPRPWF